MNDIHGVPYDNVRRNLSRLYESAPLWRRFEGVWWYGKARSTVGAIIDGSGATHADRVSLIERGCEALAILSPQCPWEVNLAAFRALAHAQEPENARGILPRNWGKAWRHYWVSPQPISTEKVRTFSEGLKTAGATREVCLDTHMLRAALARKPSSLEVNRHFANTAGCYEAIAFIVRDLAREAGIYPAQYQAIVWLVQRG